MDGYGRPAGLGGRGREPEPLSPGHLSKGIWPVVPIRAILIRSRQADTPIPEREGCPG